MAAATYKQFLASPSSALLAEKASLHYVTTTTSFFGSADIIKHLGTLPKQVKKKKEDTLHVVEGQDALALEIDTTLQFQISGGPYLLKLDDNFLSDRTVSLSITHFVTLDTDGRILQIRLQWDQGALLKQLDIIGKSGRNWPIMDSREQLALVQTSLKAIGQGQAVPAQGHNDTINRTRGNSSNALRDPHATLHIGQSREEVESYASNAVVSPYGGNKRPIQRSFQDILGDEPEDVSSPSANRQKHFSPAKAGSHKNFQPMRLFDGQEDNQDVPAQKKTNNFIKPNANKYQHFDNSDAPEPERGLPTHEQPKSKNASSWSFEDVVTPPKAQPSKTNRPQEVRHWDTDKNTIEDTPAAQRMLGNITNLKGRNNDFDPHFGIPNEEAPKPSKENAPSDKAGINIAGDGMGSRKGSEKKGLEDSGINIAGDGMGGRKGTNRNWLYGGDDDEEAPKPVAPKRTQNAAFQRSSLWDM